ncbi:MAG: MATE family efflux transporter, partial [Treponema sp.]|nr:MATE family efflux transporter [Treponema sp.]
MNIQLSDHFTYKRLFRFTIPSIFMMIFTSIYSIVDGIFTSNFAGKEAFAGLNLIMPGIMLFSGLGFMIGSGGSALVARFLGEKNQKRANEVFSFLIYATIVAG